MINWLVSHDYTLSLFSDAVTTYVAEDSVPDSLRNFLARLRLLYGVPFNYLVPDSRLLPVESIRFFYIDRNYTDRLVDGALSVGKATTREFVHAQSTNTEMKKRVDDEERVLRKQLRGSSVSSITAPKPADLTGLLLRSRAVSGWPGLEVKAYQHTVKATETEKGDRLPLLRMDRLAPDVMLCIFEGTPTRVDVEEPREGIQFGVDLHNPQNDGNPTPDAGVPSGFTLNLRWIHGAKAGQQMGVDPNHPISIPVPVRKTNRRVVHVEALRDALAVALKNTADADANPGPALTSGELALELFQFPFRQRFEDNGDPKTQGGPTWTAGSQYINAALRVSVMATPLTDNEINVLFPAPHVR
jgi:hypothetical protein